MEHTHLVVTLVVSKVTLVFITQMVMDIVDLVVHKQLVVFLKKELLMIDLNQMLVHSVKVEIHHSHTLVTTVVVPVVVLVGTVEAVLM